MNKKRRFWNLVTGNGIALEKGDTAGKVLGGLNMAMNIASMSVNDVLHELENLQVKGTAQQFSRARTGRQALSIVGELRLMEIFAMDDPNQLVEPEYPEDLAETIKKNYQRKGLND